MGTSTCAQVFGDELLSVCLEKVTKLLSDDMYFARREGAGLATVLYAKWTRPQASRLTCLITLSSNVIATDLLQSLLLLLLLLSDARDCWGAWQAEADHHLNTV